MQADFWHDRWERNQIGFHLEQVNPHLARYWPDLGLEPGARVLVPLCGKTLDLTWLAAQGYEVLGVELSETAVQAFFSEHDLEPKVSQRGGFRVYEAGPVTLLCGDFFGLSAEEVSACSGVYDRAAIIALPPQMREDYTAHLTRILPARCRGLLITLDYEQSQMQGPPFSVPDAEVQRLLAADWSIEILEQPDILGKSWKFLKGGATRLVERVYRLEKTA